MEENGDAGARARRADNNLSQKLSLRVKMSSVQVTTHNAEVTTRHTLIEIRAFYNDENGDDGDAMRRANTKSNYKSSFRSSQ